jgi:GT2 family glycosyltransferase
MADHGTLSVVVVTYDSAAVIGDCLRSVGEHAGDDLDVVVVDNASTDDSVAVARAALPAATSIVLPANRGYAAAINAGIGAARSVDAVLVLNPDVVIGARMRAQLVAAAVGTTGVAVPRLLEADGTVARSIRREPTVGRAWAEALLGGGLAARLRAGEIVTAASAYQRPQRVDWASGAVMLITRDCLEQVGPFDESFFLYSEETDFMLRARDAGFEVTYVPDAVAVHLGGELSSSAELWSRRTVNRVRLQRRRHGRVATAAFLGASLTGEGVRAVAGRSTSRRAVADLWRAGPRIVTGERPAVVSSASSPMVGSVAVGPEHRRAGAGPGAGAHGPR